MAGHPACSYIRSVENWGLEVVNFLNTDCCLTQIIEIAYTNEVIESIFVGTNIDLHLLVLINGITFIAQTTGEICLFSVHNYLNFIIIFDSFLEHKIKFELVGGRINKINKLTNENLYYTSKSSAIVILTV